MPVDNFAKGRRRFCHPCHLLASGVDTSSGPKGHQSLSNRENSATFEILVEERPVFFCTSLWLLTSVNCINLLLFTKKIYDLSSKKTQKWQEVFFL